MTTSSRRGGLGRAQPRLDEVENRVDYPEEDAEQERREEAVDVEARNHLRDQEDEKRVDHEDELMNVLMRARTTAAMSAAWRSSTTTPGRNR
jgi:hypothetical protein